MSSSSLEALVNSSAPIFFKNCCSKPSVHPHSHLHSHPQPSLRSQFADHFGSFLEDNAGQPRATDSSSASSATTSSTSPSLKAAAAGASMSVSSSSSLSDAGCLSDKDSSDDETVPVREKDSELLGCSSEMEPGDHVCALFNSTDYESIIVPWVLRGLSSHQKVVYLYAQQSIESLKRALELRGIDVDSHVRSGQLVFACARTMYCPDGRWIEDRVVNFIREQTQIAVTEGWSAARITADMTWTHDLLDDKALLHYESTVNCVFDLPLIGLCQYNRDFFSPKTLIKILQAHHLTLVGKELYRNFYYTPADILLNKKYDQKLDIQLENLRIKKVLEESNKQKAVSLKRKNEELHEEILKKERAEAELRRMHEEARKLARMKTDFLAQMSHEIRSPMNGVIGCADLLSESFEKEVPSASLISDHTLVRQKEYVETIKSAGRYLISIINDLLDHTKLEEQKLRLLDEPYNFREVVRTCLNLNSSTKHKDVLLIDNIPHDLPATLIGDSVRVSQILNNLIGNAIKFTDSGSITVSCASRRLDHTDNAAAADSAAAAAAAACRSGEQQIELLFTVQDTGQGIPENKHLSIFEPYEQTDNVSKVKGWGLGLPICKQLVSLMGGKIWLDAGLTRPGKGSTFHFSIRQRVLDTAPNSKIQKSSSSSSSSSSEEADNKRQVSILIADDMKLNQLVIGRHLEALGFSNISFVDNGRLAVEAAKSQSFDLIFMDFHMPELNGIDAIREIKSCLEPYKLPSFIILSASDADDEQLFDDSIHWLMKPVNRGKLEEALNQGLKASPNILNSKLELSEICLGKKRSRK